MAAFNRAHLIPDIPPGELNAHLRTACDLLDILPKGTSTSALCSALDTYYTETHSLPIAKACRWLSVNDKASYVWTVILRYYWPVGRWPPKQTSMSTDNYMLYNTDIIKAVSQYAVNEPSCKFIDCLYAKAHMDTGVCSDVANPSILAVNGDYFKQLMKDGIKRIGFIIATGDMKALPFAGHWMGLVIGIDPKDERTFGMTFFNSLASPDGMRYSDVAYIKDLLVDIFPGKQVPIYQLDKSMPIQTTNAPVSCGLYTLHFLVECLVYGKSLESILDDPDFTDERIDIHYRPYYFPLCRK